jgi:hypothetical protein
MATYWHQTSRNPVFGKVDARGTRLSVTLPKPSGCRQIVASAPVWVE